jgi:CheY-like chemotaxis protein
VEDFDKMLRRLVGERIGVTIDCDPALCQARADPGEFGRAIMNLSSNARNAQDANVALPEADAWHQDLAPARDVTLAAHGPFFTTKHTGKATSLGRATVLGIVKQSGGAVRCESDTDRAAVFTISLPATAEAALTVGPAALGVDKAPRGTEVVLLVEDEDMVRALTRMILETNGYVVIEACNGREGLTMCETNDGPIDLLLSDVVMPELSGGELAEEAVKLRPEMKVMFMSGYTHDIILKEGVQHGTAFLQKPFTPVELAQKVRETLDADARSGGATSVRFAAEPGDPL